MKNINIYAFADEADSNLDSQITACLENSLKGIELRNIDDENVSEISLKKAIEVKQKLDSNGLIAWSLGSPIGKIDINDDFRPHLEKFKHTLEIANTLDCKNIRLFSFYIPDGDDKSLYKNKVIEQMAEFCEAAKNSGITLCHENEKGIYGDTPERCLEIFEALPTIKGIFDPANFIQCGVNTLDAWKLLKEYISYMHIKDAKANGSVVPSGMGVGNISKIVADFLLRSGRDFTIEPHLTVFEGLSSLEREGEKTVMEFTYPNHRVAFDTACNAFKDILKEVF